MRIAVSSTYRINAETGSAMVAKFQSEKLSKDHEVMYICLGDEYRRYKNNGLQILEIPSAPLKQGFAPKISPEIIRKIYRDLDEYNPQIIHMHNFFFIDLICLVWSIKRNKRSVLTLHSLPKEGIGWILPKHSKKTPVKVVDMSIIFPYIKRFLANVDIAIAINKPAESSIREIDKKVKVKRLHNGISLKRFTDIKIKKQGKQKMFIYLGSYTERKNQEYLVNIFSHLSDNYKLKLYGNMKTGEKYVEKLEKMIVENNITNVEINGFVVNEKIPELYRDIDYMVSASTKEVQSLVVLEALAAGKPVIALRNETVDEVINEKNGLKMSKKTSPKLFAKKLTKFTNIDQSEYIKMCEHARKTGKKYDINEVIKRLVVIYQDLLKDKAATQKQNELLDIFPDQIKELFPKGVLRKKRRVIRLSIWLFWAVVVASVTYPIIKLSNLIKKYKNQ